MRDTGTSRTLLLVVLGVAVAVVVSGGYWLVASSGPGDYDDPEDAIGEEEASDLPPGAGPLQSRAIRVKRHTNPDDPDAEEFSGDDDGDIYIAGDPRDVDPNGPSFHVDDASLRQVLKDDVWEEVRRQIDVIQANGKTVPEDVVRALVEMLKTDGRRLDAMLALGQVKDAFTGKLLAEFASDPSLPEDARVQALRALAKSGQSNGLAEVRQLVEGATADTPVVRAAYFALAGMGGHDGAAPLLAALAAHPDDGLTDAVTTAISKLRDADGALAKVLRDARGSGDAAGIQVMLKVGMRMGASAGAEMQAEVRALIESPAGLAALEKDPELAERVRYDAMYVAGSMGGVALDAVIQIARSQSGPLRTVALTALRGARGDEAAAKIAGLMSAQMDVPSRYSVVAALGATGSRTATPTIHAALDDPDGSVKEIASAVIGDVRDPASVPVILSRLDGVRGNRTVAINYVKALGQIGVKDALSRLQSLAASDDAFWKEIRPWIKQAISRITSGNPDTTIMAPDIPASPAPNSKRKPR